MIEVSDFELSALKPKNEPDDLPVDQSHTGLLAEIGE